MYKKADEDVTARLYIEIDKEVPLAADMETLYSAVKIGKSKA